MDIFTVTTIGFEDAGNKKYHDRTIAVCTSLARAQEIIENNEGGLNEAEYYPLAVIELKVTDQVYPSIHYVGCNIQTQWWYQFDEQAQKYLPSEAPDRFKEVIVFDVG